MKLSTLLEPCYLFRPSQVWTRLRGNSESRVRLPWGDFIEIEESDQMGQSLRTQGVYDLALTEAILRLADEGETAVDAGANIGYMTCAMARAVGYNGQVYSFEPSTPVYERLAKNVEHWRERSHIYLYRAALSHSEGEALLSTPLLSIGNNGLSSLQPLAETARSESVRIFTLDSLRDKIRQIGVLKIDVEGHEASVLQGASGYLEEGVRDVLIEEHSPYPAPTHNILADSGFALYRLAKSLRGPVLLPPERLPRDHGRSPANYLATKDPVRAADRFRSRGWLCLRS